MKNHPLASPENALNAIATSFKSEIINGDAKSRSKYITYLLTSIGIGLVGDKGATELIQGARTVSKISKVDMPKPNINTGLTPTFESPSPGGMPNNWVKSNQAMSTLSAIKQIIGDGGKGTKGTGKYNTGTMKHIYHGEINKRGKAVGYHHESMMGGKIIPGTENVPEKNGVYKARIEIDGVKKVAKSSFFPKEWNRVDVLKAIDEAYQNKKQIGSYKYIGETSSGIKIEMFLNKDGSIATAYPLYNK